MSSTTTRAPAAVAAADAKATDLGERFADAVAYATRIHGGQTRRGRPFVAHLLRVAGLVLEDGGTEDEAIGGLLHDAVEDQGGVRRLRDIRARYGDTVAEIVESCSDSLEEPKPSWRTRKEHYVAHLPQASPSALRVSLADKVDNVRGILHDDVTGPDAPLTATARADASSAQDMHWYYDRLATLFAQLLPGARADELSRLAAELGRRVTAQHAMPR